MYNKVFVLLIPRRSASSSMLPIGTSGVYLQYRTPRAIDITFRSMLKSTIEASEAALIGDTRQKELFYLQTSPSTSVEFFQIFLSQPACILLRLESDKKIKSHHLCSR